MKVKCYKECTNRDEEGYCKKEEISLMEFVCCEYEFN